ncbi:MAG: hypothetical protein PHP74_02150 [Candidatus Gracilibacteria bacterium]|nr:hypothetical protein [Candidatus Gracilibacteria bacterium]
MMSEKLIFKDHDTERTGEEVVFEEVVDGLDYHDRMNESLTCADMDGTLFENDLGILVFLEKLNDPTLWTFSADKFRDILLPPEYCKLMILSSKEEGVDGLDREDCFKILTLVDDLVDLYVLQKSLVASSKDCLSLKNSPIVNEFARKMIEFDKYFLKVDGLLSQRPEIDGRLLMRVRFLSGKNIKMVAELTRKAMRRRNRDTVNLKVHKSNQEHFSQLIRELEDVEFGRVVKEVSQVRALIKELYSTHGSDIRVITTNLQQIADVALRQSSYDDFIPRRSTIGTTLGQKNGFFIPRVHGRPVIGEEKARMAELLMEKLRKKLQVAIGDSFSDSDMGMKSLENGGVFVAVGKDYESTRRRFDPFFQRAKAFGIPFPEKKILYAEYDK